MHTCPNCGSPLSEGRCLTCGWTENSGQAGQVEGSPIVRYFRNLVEIHTHPVRFFRALPSGGGIAEPLAFALVTHWLGSAIKYLWLNALSGMFGDLLSDAFHIAGKVADVDHPGQGALLMQARDRFLHWFWGLGAVIVDPFTTLAWILFTSVLVFVGARILVSPSQGDAAFPRGITYESAVKIVCYGLAPSILAGIPLIGPAISPLIVIIVTIIAAREVYRIGTGRAIIVALFPILLLFVIIGVVFVWVAILFLKIFASAF